MWRFSNHTTVPFAEFFASEITCLQELVGPLRADDPAAPAGFATPAFGPAFGSVPCHERHPTEIGCNILTEGNPDFDPLHPTVEQYQRAHVYGFMLNLVNLLWAPPDLRTERIPLSSISSQGPPPGCWSLNSFMNNNQRDLAYALAPTTAEMNHLLEKMASVQNRIWRPYVQDLVHKQCDSTEYLNMYIISFVLAVGLVSLGIFLVLETRKTRK